MNLSVPLFLLAVIAAGEAGDKPAATNPTVVFETTKGNITIELWPEKAPKTVENFLAYVKSGHFDGTIFHRVIPGFMIQGGGFTAEMEQKATRPPIENEARNGLSNSRGTLAMARTSDPHSASGQFFINLVDNTGLDANRAQDGWGYAVFGKVSDGMAVVDAIAKVTTGNRGGHQNVPLEPIVVKKAYVK
ncbi:MAG TPA: peptidylprolyl isomerase [Thermoanaerobaculia bacterium]|nr:peptidylprolyl isomerase [Thermoanaerobaculia bacterium]